MMFGDEERGAFKVSACFRGIHGCKTKVLQKYCMCWVSMQLTERAPLMVNNISAFDNYLAV